MSLTNSYRWFSCCLNRCCQKRQFARSFKNLTHWGRKSRRLGSDRYDLVVIGAGTAGLVVAAGAAGLGLGLKVALVEKHLMGGDCLNVGCVPSKCIIRSARVVAQMQEAGAFGIRPPEQIDVDFPAVMERMRKLRAKISPHDSARRFQKLGIDVFLGAGRFLRNNAVEVGGQTLRYKKAVIATPDTTYTHLPKNLGVARQVVLTGLKPKNRESEYHAYSRSVRAVRSVSS